MQGQMRVLPTPTQLFFVTFDDFYGDAWDVGRLAVAY